MNDRMPPPDLRASRPRSGLLPLLLLPPLLLLTALTGATSCTRQVAPAGAPAPAAPAPAGPGSETQPRPAPLAVAYLYTDLDGTALDDGGALLADNVEAIRRFRERGGHVGIATGRLPDKAQDLARALAADLPLIFANGALITDPHGALLRLLGFADAADLQRMCALVMASRCAVVYVAYASPKSGEVRVQLGSCSPSLQPGEQVVKLSARGCADHDHLFATLTGQLGRSYDVEEAGAGEQRGVSVGAAGVGKGAAIRWVAQRLGFALGQVAFVGDSGNDLSAAQVVHQGGGLCFAVANATEELKAVCPRRTVRDNGHGALAEAIRRLLGEQ